MGPRRQRRGQDEHQGGDTSGAYQPQPAPSMGTPYEQLIPFCGQCANRSKLYQLYIQPDNFSAVAERLYVGPISSNVFVRAATSHHLRKAAFEELKKTTPNVVEEDILRDGKEALYALSTLLGSDQWFFDAEGPALFDASVFAYTHLLLDEGMGWKENELGDAVRGFSNLVQHKENVLGRYF